MTEILNVLSAKVLEEANDIRSKFFCDDLGYIEAHQRLMVLRRIMKEFRWTPGLDREDCNVVEDALYQLDEMDVEIFDAHYKVAAYLRELSKKEAA